MPGQTIFSRGYRKSTLKGQIFFRFLPLLAGIYSQKIFQLAGAHVYAALAGGSCSCSSGSYQ